MAKDSLPRYRVSSKSCVKIAKNEDLVVDRLKNRGVNTKEREMLFALQSSCVGMMRSYWPVGSLSSLEAKNFFTMSPTSDRRLSDGFT